MGTAGSATAQPRGGTYTPTTHHAGRADDLQSRDHERATPPRLGREVLDLRGVDSKLAARNLASLGAAAAVAAVAMVTAWKRPRPAVLAAAALVVSSRQQALLNMEHDCTHGTFVRGRRWNDLVGSVVLGGPVGSPYFASSKRHLAHHRLVGTAADPDLDLHNAAGGGTAAGLLRHFAGGISGAYAAKLFLDRAPGVPAAPAGGVVTQQAAGLALDGPATGQRAEPGGQSPERGAPADAALERRDGHDSRRDVLTMAGTQATLFAATTAATAWWVYPVLWLVPLGTLTAGSHLVRSFVEHAVLPGERPEHDNLLISTRSNALERQLVAPFNMSHHAEHHLFPWIPARRLPEARRRIEASEAAPPILRRRSYLGTVVRHLQARRGVRGRR
jgi:fatty acid desaturase